MKSALNFNIDNTKRGHASTSQPMLRVRDYMNAMLVPSIEGAHDVDFMPMNDSVLIALFGSLPNYRETIQERMWQQVDGWGAAETARLMLEKGVDLMGADGRPVRIWRDVAVMILLGRALYQDDEYFIAA